MTTLSIEEYGRDAVLQRLETLVGPEVARRATPALEQLLRVRTAQQFHDAERQVHQVLREVADDVVSLGLQAVALDPEFEAAAKERVHAAGRAAEQPMKSHGRHETPVRLLGGKVVRIRALKMQPGTPKDRRRVKRSKRRGKLGRGVYPVLAELGVTGFSTPALRAEVAYAMASANSMSAARSALKRQGLDLPHKMFLRLGYDFADRSLAVRREQVTAQAEPVSTELVGQHVFVSIDGGRLRIRESPTHGRRNAKGHRRYQAPWREPKVLTVYIGDPQNKKAQCVVVDATLGGADDAVALLVGHLRLRGAAKCASLTLVADGAHWIWNRAGAIREAVEVPAERFREVVDFYHVVQKLGEAATAMAWETPQQKSFLDRCRRRLRKGQVGLVLDELLALKREAPQKTAKQLEAVLGYFDNHDTRMAYDEAKALNLPLGSGSVESAVRRVVNQRLKSTSTFWVEEHAEGVLHLRAHIKAGAWDALVSNNLAGPHWTPTLTEAA